MSFGKELKKKNVFVILGGTGDLMQNKIAPSLFHLFSNNVKDSFGNDFIIGCGRSEYTDETYRDLLKAGIEKKLNIKDNNEKESFLEKVFYSQGDLSDDSFYKNLYENIYKIVGQKENLNIIFYFSIHPKLFDTVIPKIKSAGEGDVDKTNNIKLIIEKPFGKDEASAEALNNLILQNFEDENIFRVEHYLAKSFLQSMRDFRKENLELENILNKSNIEEVKVYLLETLDVDTRGTFYDDLGVIRDVMQNHLLQILALVLGDLDLSEKDSKIKFFKENFDFEDKDISDIKTFQYEGYKNIKGVRENSRTETAAILSSHLQSEKYKDIKLGLVAGKAIKESKKSLEIIFKENVLYEEKQISKIVFDIILGKVILYFTKNNLDNFVEEFVLDPNVSHQYVVEYAKIFAAASSGSQDVSASFEEIKYMWRYIDTFIKVKEEENILPEVYKKGFDFI